MKEEIPFLGKSIPVKELSIKEVTEIIINYEVNSASYVIEELTYSKLPASAIEASTGLRINEMEKLRPSILIELITCVEKANDLFVGMIERRRTYNEEMKDVIRKIQHCA